MLHEDLIDVMPAVEEANSISEELDKRVKFEIILIAPNMLGKLKHKHEGFEDRDKTSSQPEVFFNILNINRCINDYYRAISGYILTAYSRFDLA